MTGHESSILAFLGQRPMLFSNFEEELRRAKDPLVLPVARHLAGVQKSIDPDVVSTAEYIWEWVRGIRERSHESK
jgi:hypothetical protein